MLKILAVVSSLLAAPYHANLDQSLAPFESQPVAIFLGDSLTLREGTFYDPLRSSIQARLGSGGPGWQSCSVWTGWGFDPGWVRGQINDDSVPHLSTDGLWAQMASASTTGWARIDPSPGTTRVQLVLNGSGSVGVWNTITNQTTFHSAPGVIDIAATGRLWIQPQANGAVTVLGALCTNNLAGAVLSRGANGGWGVSNFLQRDATFEQVLDIVGPKLVWVTLGQNDTPDYAPGEYVTAMRLLVTRIKAACPNAGIVLCSSYDSGSQAIARLCDEVYEAAVQEGVGFVNLWAAGGPYSHFVSHNYLDDGIHFSPQGGVYVAGILDQAIQTHGRSLRWCSGDVNQDGATDGADLSVMLSSFSDGVEAWESGDLNGDGVVNGADLSVLLGNFSCHR